ncbi:unnamed protein product, partial [Musa hybrid cultivar]
LHLPLSLSLSPAKVAWILEKLIRSASASAAGKRAQPRAKDTDSSEQIPRQISE